MYCAKCGAQVPAGAKFCTICGTPVVAPAAMGAASAPLTIGGKPVVPMPTTPPPPLRPIAAMPLVAPTAMLPVAPAAALHTAGMWRRLGTILVDVVGTYLFSFLVGLLYGMAALGGTSAVVAGILGFLSYPLYFILFESIWQRTPGKWAMGTKVVALSGAKPGFWRIVGRSLSRMIPFEWFSFHGEYPFGWHDRISGTMVVPAAYSPQDIASVNPHDRGKGKVGLFVIIIAAVIIFIGIIGVLASIVLVSLNTARNKGADIQVISELNMARTNAEVFWSQGNSYEGACDDPQVASHLNAAAQVTSATNYGCSSSKDGYIMAAPLKTGGYYCIDSVPEIGSITDITGGGATCKDFPGFQAD